MNRFKASLRFVGFWLAVTVATGFCTTLAGVDKFVKPQPELMGITAGMMLVVTLVYCLVTSFVVVNSAWKGAKLVGVIFLVFFGINGFLAQIESLVFLKYLVNILPNGVLPHIVLNSALQAVCLALLAPLFYGKLTGKDEPNPNSNWLQLPAHEWVWKVALCAAAYVVVYLAFGRWVLMPLAGEAFGKYYGDLKLPSWFIPFQFGRGLIWIGIAIPFFFLMKGPRWKAGLAISLMFAAFIGIIMIVPNPFFPDRMRFAHLAELLSSSFTLGWIFFFVFTFRRKKS